MAIDESARGLITRPSSKAALTAWHLGELLRGMSLCCQDEYPFENGGVSSALTALLRQNGIAR
jgi:hypothetical protein